MTLTTPGLAVVPTRRYVSLMAEREGAAGADLDRIDAELDDLLHRQGAIGTALDQRPMFGLPMEQIIAVLPDNDGLLTLAVTNSKHIAAEYAQILGCRVERRTAAIWVVWFDRLAAEPQG